MFKESDESKQKPISDGVLMAITNVAKIVKSVAKHFFQFQVWKVKT